ncbi:MAG TPA: methyltransferase domain-containing protein [Noviherbaspirillum sp.]|uniref:tRNA (guanine(46)-N(7))-methyltransferase TrmB n=1 Tax=Noviherbaspirillum sp. TaxID=1926288 RepID=UPI002B47CB49|nr:methyltransferase domain-containing protein [Noviherbaspirillum sp.]HJV87330.1 methyltransferase domain-containing protein [Noviherbaspirillum sp.]
MYANSRPVTSAQTTIHERLASVVANHAGTRFLKPVMPYNQEAFERSMTAWREAGERPLILDAGCGVGLSTRHLAAQFPNHFVIGVDQSAHRLTRNTAWEGPLPSNFLCVRADLVDYWRLMLKAGVHPQRHYLLYPNPWPKIGQLGRRWHGHPVFPTIVALGGILECRSNWRIYVEEFAAALVQLTGLRVQCEEYVPDSPVTPFEKKYMISGHALWRCRTNPDTATGQTRLLP